MIKRVKLNRLLAIAVVLAVWAGLMAIANANHGMRTLDAYPESQPKVVDERAIIVAKLSSAATDGDVNISFENKSGPNDPEDPDATSPHTPDLSCDVPQGGDRCSVSYIGEATGNDDWLVWIDHGSDSEAEADDSEADANEPLEPGTTS